MQQQKPSPEKAEAEAGVQKLLLNDLLQPCIILPLLLQSQRPKLLQKEQHRRCQRQRQGRSLEDCSAKQERKQKSIAQRFKFKMVL